MGSSSSLEIIRIKNTKWRAHTYFRWNGSKEFAIKNYVIIKNLFVVRKVFILKDYTLNMEIKYVLDIR